MNRFVRAVITPASGGELFYFIAGLLTGYWVLQGAMWWHVLGSVCVLILFEIALRWV